jgi:hypothetical protein
VEAAVDARRRVVLSAPSAAERGVQRQCPTRHNTNQHTNEPRHSVAGVAVGLCRARLRAPLVLVGVARLRRRRVVRRALRVTGDQRHDNAHDSTHHLLVEAPGAPIARAVAHVARAKLRAVDVARAIVDDEAAARRRVRVGAHTGAIALAPGAPASIALVAVAQRRARRRAVERHDGTCGATHRLGDARVVAVSHRVGGRRAPRALDVHAALDGVEVEQARVAVAIRRARAVVRQRAARRRVERARRRARAALRACDEIARVSNSVSTVMSLHQAH